ARLGSSNGRLGFGACLRPSRRAAVGGGGAAATPAHHPAADHARRARGADPLHCCGRGFRLDFLVGAVRSDQRRPLRRAGNARAHRQAA
ncbi:hypothetical protein DQE84_15490, partial [Staphylococcus warneri]